MIKFINLLKCKLLYSVCIKKIYKQECAMNDIKMQVSSSADTYVDLSRNRASCSRRLAVSSEDLRRIRRLI